MTTAMMPEARPGPERLWRAMYIAESELRTLVELYRLPMTNAGTVEVRTLTPEEQAVADAWNAWRLAFHEVEDFVRTATGKLIVRDAMLNGNPTLSPQVAKMREVL